MVSTADRKDSDIDAPAKSRSRKVDWRRRLITAGIAIPTLFLMIYLPWPAFSLTVAIGTALGYYEFRKLADIRDLHVAVTMHVIMLSLMTSLRPLTLLLAPFLIGILPLLTGGPAKGFKACMLNIFYFSTFALPMSYAVSIRTDFVSSGPFLTLLWLLISFASDAGALVIGSRFGKSLMCPSVSPAKTWEGLLGAVVAGVGTAYFFSLLQQVPVLKTVDYILLGLFESLAGMVGDLLESGFKRFTLSKDSGNILPGHGGMLDRLDALAITAPIAYYFFLTKGVV